jgi:hypothetical protein
MERMRHHAADLGKSKSSDQVELPFDWNSVLRLAIMPKSEPEGRILTMPTLALA